MGNHYTDRYLNEGVDFKIKIKRNDVEVETVISKLTYEEFNRKISSYYNRGMNDIAEFLEYMLNKKIVEDRVLKIKKLKKNYE